MSPPKRTDELTPEVARAVLEEISGVHTLPSPPHNVGFNWGKIRDAFALIATAAALAWGLSRAYFVPRAEWDARLQSEAKREQESAVAHEALRQTLAKLDTTIAEHARAFREEAAAIQELKIQIAVMRAANRK